MEFCRSTESPVERYLRLKQEARETPRTFLWRLNTAAVKANADYRKTSGCCRHLNQFLKNLRDRELQLSLQSQLYLSTDEMEDTLRQVEEMERGRRRKPTIDLQFATSRESREPSSEELQWEDDDDEAYGYQYNEEDNDYDVQSPRQEGVFRADDPRERSRAPEGFTRRGLGPAPGSPPCAECGRLGHPIEKCWRLMTCDRCGGKHPTNVCRRRECEACGQLHPAGECAILEALKKAAQRGQLQGVSDEVLQHLRKGTAPPSNN
ncbi:hypothetical protein PHYPSEUDO_007800 [Phytophthora pseudosyringae]|uniref:CCHC-type domain-containing protein n=1 Tax=Phytophthora pseudosyringae TaxID=221518 RepID=A0A8T1VL34_9STRA|nr:hypothetical protein PHYPSEUDO_007800 [Phytophthora pseudosyringae]